MFEKKSEWNSVIARGDGICGACEGSARDPHTWRDHVCEDCHGSLRCKWCEGQGITGGWHCDRCSNNGSERSYEQYYEAVGKHTPLPEVLAAISEETMARDIYGKYDAVREGFPLEKTTVASLEEYTKVLRRYMERWQRKTKHSLPWLIVEDSESGGAKRILKGIYGDLVLAYRLARSGESGGLHAQLDLLNDELKRSRAKMRREAILDYFEWEAKERLLEEYLEAYGSHLAAEYRRRRPIMLVAEFSQLLVQHATTIEPALRAAAEKA